MHRARTGSRSLALIVSVVCAVHSSSREAWSMN